MRQRSRSGCSARSESSARSSAASPSGWCRSLVAYLAWWALTGGGLEEAWNRPGEGGLTTWQGVDIVVGVTVSWIPLAADYTRFARSPRAAFWGTGIGYGIPDALLLSLGAIVLLTRDVADAAALPAAIAAGGLVALLALVALTAAETDEAFANAYSGAVSLQNLVPRRTAAAPRRPDDDARDLGALVLELTSFQSFLFLLGSCFVPLFAVLLADWLAHGLRYEPEDLATVVAVRFGPIAAWVAGFAAYQWLSPTGPAWWVEQVQRLDPPSWSIGATLPSFVVALALALALRRRDRDPERPATRTRVSRIALIGNACVDRIGGGPTESGRRRLPRRTSRDEDRRGRRSQ